ncbi:tRNA (adenosine(37)-N6)-threonylcarbamoyltransferase complex transferase subunit TsaD [bacterium]|nr:tRNA (adenosine(37)-N6)-threonylcarbamoyltransferase complex transferase subunit TsaD [bacterium]
MRNLILGVESSCDDTCLALVDQNGKVLAESSFSQTAIHQCFGGVVPEVASRSHFERLEPLFGELISQVIDKGSRIQSVAASCTPGLVGPLLVGASFARGLAQGWQIPFIGIHHLRAHVASIFLERQSNRPMREQLEDLSGSLVVLVSGGHTQILQLGPELSLKVLASTADDAAGECFDKSAKIMGLPYPGGPSIEKLALSLSEADSPIALSIANSLPRPRSKLGFSFAGLKTAIKIFIEKNPDQQKSAATAWAIQEVIGDTIVATIRKTFKESNLSPSNLFFCGGVSANTSIRKKLEELSQELNCTLHVPPVKFSTDNAAMVAACAWLQSDKFNENTITARQSLG